jgi:hypothetical protein
MEMELGREEEAHLVGAAGMGRVHVKVGFRAYVSVIVFLIILG